MAESLWNALSQSRYAVNWHYIPGKPAGFYKGTEPHGAVLRTFVNNIAYDAIVSKAGGYPDGAIIVKENYAPDSKQLGAITVMKKTKGFEPKNGDWFWAKYAPDGSVQASGKVGGCIGCHAQKKASDWIFSGNK
jgi:hypothetical protein